MLEKTRTVLEIAETTASFTGVVFEPEPDPEYQRTTRLSLDRDVWEDMGKPTTVTLTVEPGDKLNDGTD